MSRRALEALPAHDGYEVTAVADGTQAWEILQSENPPRLAILDWLMDEMDGLSQQAAMCNCDLIRSNWENGRSNK